MGELEQAQALVALGELRTLVHRLGEEVGAFRKRALQAETRVRELENQVATITAEAAREAALREARAKASDQADRAVTPERLAELERENADLRRRLDEAAGRVRQLLDRARFLRQQEEEENRS